MRNSSSSSIEVYEEINDNEVTFAVSFGYTAWYTPAKIYGDPADCYPEDYGSDYDITEILMDGKKVNESEISKDIVDRIHSQVHEWVEENGLNDIDDGSDFYERDYYDRDYGI